MTTQTGADGTGQLGRRALLATVAGGAAAAVVGLRAEPADAATGAMQYGTTNDAGADTTTLTSASPSSTMHLLGTAGGVALLAEDTSTAGSLAINVHSVSGRAIQASAALRVIDVLSFNSEGVHAVTLAPGAAGVHGVDGTDGSVGSGTGVIGESPAGIGIDASSVTGTAVNASTMTGTAVSATADEGPGIVVTLPNPKNSHAALSAAVAGSGPAIEAIAPAGSTALSVQGALALSRSGTAVVRSGASSATVSVGTISASTIVLLTPQNNVAGVAVQGTTRDVTSGKFTVHLTTAAPSALRLGWMLIG